MKTAPPITNSEPSLQWPSVLRVGLTIGAASIVLIVTLVLMPSGHKPLWPGAHYTNSDRDAALERGLAFIDGIASNPKYFSRWGHDLLFCFYTISTTSKNLHLREMAHRMGEKYALQWRREHPEPPLKDAAELYFFVEGSNAADGILGNSTASVKQHVREAAARFSAADFLAFDPALGPPPANIPAPCKECDPQKGSLEYRNPYDVLTDALIRTYNGDIYGVKLGASYPEVLKCLVAMRPYPAVGDDEDVFDNVSLTITHVIYTSNGYNKYRLSPTWMPQEFNFLKTNIHLAEEYGDGEMLGEFMDTLRAFGMDESNPEIQAGMNYLLSHQNPDGSWGDPAEDSIYTRYHATWTAIDGLRQYAYQDQRLRLPEMLPLLHGAAR